MPKVYDQIGKDQVIFNRLWKPQQWSGGRTIQATVKFAMNSQGGSYAGLEVLNATKETTRTRADWGRPRQLYQPVVFDNLDISLNKNEQFFDLVDQEMAEMKDSLQDKVCTQLHGDGTGNSNKNLLGLIAGADDGTNVGTYGGIVRSTYTWFKGYYNASGGVLATSTMATAWDACKSGNNAPTFIDTTEAMWTAYEDLLTPQARYNFDSQGYPKVDGGFDALFFRKAPVIADEYCASGYMWFLNEKTWVLHYVKHAKHPTDSKGFTLRPMAEPTNQDGQVGYLLFAGELVCTEPRRNGCVRGLS